MERTILHCDMNNFYASVECMLNPELRGLPVAVCGRTEERHGIVLAKNYLAKGTGVATGEAIWQAKLKCPGLVTVDPHYTTYMKYSSLAREIYREYTDRVEAFGMDENWLDVTSSCSLFGSGEKIADEIRSRIKTELGLTISVGVSFNKIFAKLGSDMRKPDATTCITRENFRDKIWSLPASDLLGVGRATAKQLNRAGVHTIGQLAAYPEAALLHKFGILGPKLKQYACGEDNSRVMEQDFAFPIKSIGNGITFLSDLVSEEEVRQMIFALSDEVSHRLREARKRALGISLTVKCTDLACKEWQERLDAPSQNSTDLALRAFELFRRYYPWVKNVRAMTVRAISLCEEDAPQQLNVFLNTNNLRKTEALDRVLDELHLRYGQKSLGRASLMNLPKMPVIDEDIEIRMPSNLPV